MSLSKLHELVMYREAWGTAVNGTELYIKEWLNWTDRAHQLPLLSIHTKACVSTKEHILMSVFVLSLLNPYSCATICAYWACNLLSKHLAINEPVSTAHMLKLPSLHSELVFHSTCLKPWSWSGFLQLWACTHKHISHTTKPIFYMGFLSGSAGFTAGTND